jgi:acyl-CoA thioester hydrolase
MPDSKRLTPANLEKLPVTHECAIPESYLDDMGHVNVMWYTHFFSCGTVKLFEHHGMTGDYFINNNAGSFALEAHVRYLAELRVGKRITVRSRAVARSAKRSHNIHFVVNEDDNVIAATGEFVGAHIDMQHRRMAPIPEDIGRQWDALIAQHNKVGWDPPLCGFMRP